MQHLSMTPLRKALTHALRAHQRGWHDMYDEIDPDPIREAQDRYYRTHSAHPRMF